MKVLWSVTLSDDVVVLAKHVNERDIFIVARKSGQTIFKESGFSLILVFGLYTFSPKKISLLNQPRTIKDKYMAPSSGSCFR